MAAHSWPWLGAAQITVAWLWPGHGALLWLLCEFCAVQHSHWLILSIVAVADCQILHSGLHSECLLGCFCYRAPAVLCLF
jgi:hypothetical protein